MSLSRCPFANLSILVFSHLDCSAYVLPQVTVEQQMRQCTWYFTIVFTVTQPLLVPSPEHLVQAAFEERWTFHTEILEVLQPEDLRGKLKKSLMVLFLSNRPMNRGEKESLNISHLAQERSKLGQGGQLLGETQFYLLYTVQLHHTENFLNVFFGPWNNFYLLTAQVHGAFPLLHPPEEVGEEFDRGLCLETKFYVYHQGSQWVLCPWHVLSHWCHQWAWGHMVHVSRPHVPEVLASISQVQHPQFASPVGKQKIRWDSLKYSLNETTASELRQHSNFPSVLYITFLIYLLSFLFPLLLTFLQLLFTFHPSHYTFARYFPMWSQQCSKLLSIFRSLWSTPWSFTLPDTSSFFQDTQDPTKLPGLDSPGVNFLGQQDIKTIQHCLYGSLVRLLHQAS